MKAGIYKHFKGQLYEVFHTAKHSETEELHVVYKPLYGDAELWLRPLSMFDEELEREGKTFKRFTYLAATLDEAKRLM